MSERDKELQAALDAWEDWRNAKNRSDQTKAFADCHDTAQKWVRFQNLYLGHTNQFVTTPTPSAVVLPFGGQA